MRNGRLAVLLAGLALLTGCVSGLHQSATSIDRDGSKPDQSSRLSKGMTRDEVFRTLGSPRVYLPSQPPRKLIESYLYFSAKGSATKFVVCRFLRSPQHEDVQYLDQWSVDHISLVDRIASMWAVDPAKLPELLKDDFTPVNGKDLHPTMTPELSAIDP